MDYPDPDEDEFELMHAQELEMMKEMEEEEYYVPPDDVPVTKTKRSLDFQDCVEETANKRQAASEENGPNNRQLSSPKLSEQISSVESPDEFGNYLPLVDSDQITTEDLFGDINDIDFNEQIYKRPRLDVELSEDQKKDILIKKILEQRNQSNINNKNNSALKTALEFREENFKECVSKKVPKWPFIPVTDTSHQRFYFRLRSEDFLDSKVKELHFNKNYTGLLDMSFQELKEMALREVINKEELKSKDKENKENIAIEAPQQELWVERYKPKNYCQLLSDESTNRALLYWLKQWDKVVFQRDPPGRREQSGSQPSSQQKDSNKPFNQNTLWKNKNDISDLVFQLDQHGRPYFKIAMLCGPPGLGKTTLAHMLARQAGYNVVEVNASDDRSVQAFRTKLEAATQMKAVMGAEPRPNCIILDEIDGAPAPSVDFLVKFVSDKNENKGRKDSKKANKGLLKRPIICICNDVYVPALRPLRQIAYTLNVPPTSSARLGERLMEITRKEFILTDLGTMMALSDKTNNDIRSCLSFLHCLKTDEKRVTLTQVHSSNIGTKDTQQGLFSVWQTIFHYKINKMCNMPPLANKRSNSSTDSVKNFSERSLRYRVDNVRRTVQSFGDYDRLTMGVFENYLRLKSIDSSMNIIANASRWFCFQDALSTSIQSSQDYTLYPYLVYPFISWHLLFATINWPKLTYPHNSYEVNIRSQRIIQILHFTLLGMPAQVQAYQDKLKLLLDTIPYLLELIIPSIRPVSIQLYTPKEKAEVERVTNAMADYNLSYSQERTQEGSYHYKLDPDIEEVGLFGIRERSRIFSYTGKQMVSREVEAEKLRRLAAMANNAASVKTSKKDMDREDKNNHPAASNKTTKDTEPESLPSHLQKLTPKALKKPAKVKQKDFFGRVVSVTLDKETTKAKTDDIVKSDVWYHFKEGYNNAVRKSVLMSDLY
uniref:Putative dna replication checkpoint protein n=1 Tax=Triatoma infestans TaxID=30076 RepID=A0A023F1H3_TRIIF